MTRTLATWIGGAALLCGSALTPALAGQTPAPAAPSPQDLKFQTFIHDERAVAIDVCGFDNWASGRLPVLL